MNNAALDGFLIVSLEQAVAAPYCSRLLAEAGARVLKLERPEGDFARAYDTIIQGDSAYFVWLNSGKESVVVDLKADTDQQLLRNLLGRADVFLQNLRPGAVDRLGFSYEAVRQINPNVVMCSISGYGSDGEHAQMKAYDTLIQAETGLCSVTGPPDQPSKVGMSICDISTGLAAYAEILKALLRRSKEGRGSHVQLSLFEVVSEWMAVALTYYEYGDKLLSGTGLDHAQIAPCSAFSAADGPVVIIVQNEREWRQLCTGVLDQESLVDDPRYKDNVRRVENRDALRIDIEAYFQKFPRTDIIEKLQKNGIACGGLNDVTDLARHPALQRKTVKSSGNEISLVRRIGDEISATAHVPSLDEHGAIVRAEFQ